MQANTAITSTTTTKTSAAQKMRKRHSCIAEKIEVEWLFMQIGRSYFDLRY